MNIVAMFFAGVLLCNCIPHLACGLQGAPFPTPFARPSGIGESSPLVNFLWGAFNVFLGITILAINPVVIGPHAGFAALVVGSLVAGTYMSLHFAKVRRNKITT
jgi:hypothetical protein